MIGHGFRTRKVLIGVALASLVAAACGDDDDRADSGKAGAAGSETAGAASGDAGAGNSGGKAGTPSAGGGTTSDAGTTGQVPEGGMGGATYGPDGFSAFVHELIQKQTAETNRPQAVPEFTDPEDEHGHYQLPGADFDDLL